MYVARHCSIITGMNQLVVTCPSDNDTLSVGEKLAANLKGGELVELTGDVGAGKTTLVKGLAKGLGSTDNVTSPSFALQNTYQGRLVLHHFDLYRLNEGGLMDHEIKDALEDNKAVSVIEWAGISDVGLPDNRIIVNFKVVDETTRQLTITLPEEK